MEDPDVKKELTGVVKGEWELYWNDFRTGGC